MGWVHQLPPPPPEPPLEVHGVGRVVGLRGGGGGGAGGGEPALHSEHVLEVYFTRRPTDNEMRAFNEWVRAFADSEDPSHG